MFLAKKINKKVQQLRNELKQYRTISHETLCGLIEVAIKPFGARLVVIKHDSKKNFIHISGFFECDRVRQPIGIEIHLSSQKTKVGMNNLDGLMFLLFQTLCHELNHKYQYQFRDGDSQTWFYELDDQTAMTEEQNYLAEVDEIDCYAHDIALELIRDYPHDYMHQLGNLNPDSTVSWEIYVNAFRNTKWSDIRKQLLKKTYLHICVIKENNEYYLS